MEEKAFKVLANFSLFFQLNLKQHQIYLMINHENVYGRSIEATLMIKM